MSTEEINLTNNIEGTDGASRSTSGAEIIGGSRGSSGADSASRSNSGADGVLRGHEAVGSSRAAAGSGILYLCATPIGNLGDITERVLRTLEEVDLIAAEDTRNTLRLLNHFEIKKPLTSYHEYNKYTKADELIAGIRVTSLPGACALITALTMSGMPARRFCFEGFLPTDKKERRYILAQLQREERTMILYEAPHHLRGTLEELYENLGDRRITLCRELTKKFEEALPMTLASAIAYYEENEPRGEYVLVLEGADRAQLEEEKRRSFEEMTLEEHMEMYTTQGLSRKEAMKKVAADRGVSKREIYKELL